MLLRLAAASAAALLLAGAASAQPADPAPAPATDSAAPAATPSDTPAADANGYNTRPASGAPTDLTTAKAGDEGIVSNGPVPDTPENRAKYGKPDSNAGKHTSAKGN